MGDGALGGLEASRSFIGTTDLVATPRSKNFYRPTNPACPRSPVTVTTAVTKISSQLLRQPGATLHRKCGYNTGDAKL